MTTRRPFPWEASYQSNVSWDITLTSRPVFAMLDDTAKAFANRPAFNFMDKQTSWGDISKQVNALAKGLLNAGLKKGNKVGLFLPNCPIFLIGYYAILKAGGTVVNMNPLYAKDEIKHLIEDSKIKFVITTDLKILCDAITPMLEDTDCLEKLIIADFSDLLPFPKNILFNLLKAKDKAKISYNNETLLSFKSLTNNDGVFDPVAINPDKDIAVIQYTGGTTGIPKGAMLSHANVSSNVEQICAWITDLKDGEERMMGVIPFFHVFAMTAVMNLSVKKAMEIIALPRFELDQTLKAIHKHKPTVFPAVPAIYTAINAHKKRDQYDLSSIKYCVSGGAPLPVEVKKEFERVTGCVLVEGYGLTETSPVVTVNPLQGNNPDACIGLPLPLTDIRLIDPDTGKEVKQGERGELCVKGPQVMQGYLNQKDMSVNFQGEYLRTGDIAIMDEAGFFYIVDRLKDMIITNGYNVYPRYVEEALYAHPAIEECVVAGIPDKTRGEIVKAWIKSKDGASLSEDNVRSFLKDKLSKIEQPRVYEIRTQALPKTMIGKLSRKALVDEELSKKSNG